MSNLTFTILKAASYELDFNFIYLKSSGACVSLSFHSLSRVIGMGTIWEVTDG